MKKSEMIEKAKEADFFLLLSDDDIGVGFVKKNNHYVYGQAYFEGMPDDWCFDICDLNVAETFEEAIEGIFEYIYNLICDRENSDDETYVKIANEINLLKDKPNPNDNWSVYSDWVSRVILPIYQKYWDTDKIDIDVDCVLR